MLRSINLGLDPRSRLATNHMAQVGAQAIVDATGAIRRLEQRSHHCNLQIGLFAHLTLDTPLFAFALFASTTRQHPERRPALSVDDLQQQHVVLMEDRSLVAHITSQHQYLLNYRASSDQV